MEMIVVHKAIGIFKSIPRRMWRFVVPAVFFAISFPADAQKFIKTLGSFNGSISELQAVEDKVFIANDDGIKGNELWISDGTRSGTVLLKDIEQGPAPSDPKELTVLNGQLIFTASNSEFGKQIWTSDGTADGTVRLSNVDNTVPYGSPRFLTVFKDHVFFSGGQKLYKTDGTSEGTVLVDENVDFEGPQSFCTTTSHLYYRLGQQIFGSDGNSASPVTGPEVEEGLYLRGIYAAGDNLYSVYATSGMDHVALYRYNGASDWDLLKDFTPLTEDGEYQIDNFTALGDLMIFNLRSIFWPTHTEDLWVTDGTAEGTTVINSSDWTQSASSNFTAFNNKLMFRHGNDNESLWTTDGTTEGTMKVHDIRVEATYHTQMGETILIKPVVANNLFYFAGRTGSSEGSSSLWVSDGTTEGTHLYLDPPSSIDTPYLFTAANDIVYYAGKYVGYNNLTRYNLWNTMPAPEISIIEGGFNHIVTGQVVQTNAAKIDECVMMELGIRNDGDKELFLSKAEIMGPEFFLDGSIPEIIKAKEEATIKIWFMPLSTNALNTKTGMLNIHSNDSNEPVFVVNLSGQVFDEQGSCQSFGANLVKTLIAEPLPKAITLSNSTIEEMKPAGTTVGNLSTSGTGVTYSLVAGEGDADNVDFQVVGNVLKTNASFDYNAQKDYSVRVKAASAGETQTAALAIHVTQKTPMYVAGNCETRLESFNYGILDMAVNSQGVVFHVGTGGRIFKSTNDGVSWQQVKSGVTARLYKIDFRSNTGFILGGNVVLKSEDNGTTWFQLDVPTDPSSLAYSAFYFNENEIYLGVRGFSGGGFFASSDGGKTWERIGYYDASSMWFFDKQHGIATDGYEVRKTSDGGENWDIVNGLPCCETYSSFQFLDDDVGFMSNNYRVLKTIDGGNSWNEIENFSGGGSVRFVDGTGFVLGENVMYTSINNGVDWSVVDLPAYGLISGIAKSPVTGRFFISHISTESSVYALQRAVSYSDNGTDWSLFYEMPGGSTIDTYTTVDFPTSSTGLAFYNGSVLKTSDGGVTWKNVANNRFIQSCYFFDATHGVASADGYLYETANGGESFTGATINKGSTPEAAAGGNIYYYSDNLMIAYDWSFGYRSTDKGKTWNIFYSGNPNEPAIIDVQFISESIGYRIDLEGSVNKTINGGVDWTPVFTSDPSDVKSYHAVFFVNEQIGFKGGEILEKSIDGGVTWNKVDAQLGGDIMELFFTDPSHGYSVRRGGGEVYETTDGGNTWTSYGGTGATASIARFRNNLIYIAGDYGTLAKIDKSTLMTTQPGYVSGMADVCLNDITDYTLPPIEYGVYQWTVSSGEVESKINGSRIRFTEPGDVTITVRSLNNCGISTERTQLIHVIDLNEPIIGSDHVAPNEGSVYHIDNIPSTVSYDWSVSGDESTTGRHTEQITVTWAGEPGDGKVSVMLTERELGCRAAIEKDITISGEPVLGVNETTDDVLVYPNATSDFLNVESRTAKAVNVTVLDVTGRQLLATQISPNGSASIDLSKSAAGIYFVKIDAIKTIRILKK